MIRFPRHWHLGLAFVMAFSIIAFVSPVPAAAAGRSWLGISDYVPAGVRGSWGVIGTTNPASGASFEMIKTSNYYQGSEHFVQIGWTLQQACGSITTVMWEWYDGSQYSSTTNPPGAWCDTYFPGGDNDYATQYNPTNGYWCYDYNGVCIHSMPSTNPQLTVAYYVGAYGETGDPSAQMGGSGVGSAIYLTNLRYFDMSNQPVWITQSNENLSFYTTCGATPCPYGWGYNWTASVLYTYNWTY